MKRFVSIFIILYCANGFTQNIPVFKPLRYDENYLYLKKDTVKNWYSKTKYSPLSKSGNTYLSYGGEIRFQYFYSKNEGWGDEPEDKDGYVLTRWLAHTDYHAGKHFRAFVQLQSSLANSRFSPGPVDDNPLEVHQAFADVNVNVFKKATLTFRTGRQELLYGSQRLVSVRDGPNNRQSFDAVKSILLCGDYKGDLFFSHYVAAKSNIFDDRFNRNTQFWGAYTAGNNLQVLNNIDLYYFGLWKRSTAFDDGQGKEIRHSVGARIWSSKGAWQYDVEGLYQFGRFAGNQIFAWTASLNTSYTFNHLKLKPEVGLKTELISGDEKYGDDKLQTFNPLFPRGAYFGLAALIGPANLVDVHPSLSLNVTSKLNLDIDYDLFWRYSVNDGLYGVNAALIYTGRNTNEKHIGRQLAGGFIYRPNNFIYFRGEFTWFDAGGYLKTVGAGKDILFSGVTMQIKF